MQYFRPWLWCRRQWARLTHRHDWHVVYSMKYAPEQTGQSVYGLLERCWCGQERGWSVWQNKRGPLEVLWLREYAKERNEEVIDH